MALRLNYKEPCSCFESFSHCKLGSKFSFFPFSFSLGPVPGCVSAIMLKRITRFTPPEVIVGLLAPYVRLSTSSVRIMKNKAGRMGQTYGFIELESHAVSTFLLSPAPSVGI